MTRFKVKDLMIDVLPSEKAELGDLGVGCRIIRSCPALNSQCGNYITGCLYNTDICRLINTRCGYLTPLNWCTPIHTTRVIIDCEAGTMIEWDPGEWVIDPAELDILHEQLRVGLQQVEIAQKKIASQMAPQTVQEVETLEKKLTEALGELASLKKGMKKG